MRMGKDKETALAILRNGDRLNGVPGAEFLALQTVFGPVRVAVADLDGHYADDVCVRVLIEE